MTLDPTEAPLRPDLSATADIITEMRKDALAVPIIALTVRERDEEADSTDSTDSADSGVAAPESDGKEETDVEGVFVVEDGTVTFVEVEVGIAGQEYFEILSGISVGDTVVAGPYQRIRQLSNGDQVKSVDGPTVN